MMRIPDLTRPTPRLAGMAFLLLGAASCSDGGKASQAQATELSGKLAPIVQEDVRQVRQGLPAGAEKLASLLDSDPGANLLALQKAISGARSSVKDLEFAKSTFFSFTDLTGTVLRSEADPDMLANKSVLAAFPDLKKALDPGSGVVEAFGEMQEMRGVRNGPDLAWVNAHPVKDAEGKAKGMFITGWSFRSYAYRLQDAARREIMEMVKRDSLKAAPVLYVFAFKGAKAYGESQTPDVNTETIEKLDLQAKTAVGPWSGTVEITGRTFGVAAQRTPDLAPDAGVAALVSGI